jgi:MYXO-CTERM domain-containing protein
MKPAFFSAVVLLSVSSYFAAPAPAAVQFYTFDAPNFVPFENSPLLNRAPNIGSPGFLANFTASPNANGLQIDPAFQPNPLLLPAILFLPTGQGFNTLTITFNAPVLDFALDFATISPGTLEVSTPTHVFDFASVPVGGAFPGGHAAGSDAPFATLQVRAFNSNLAPVEFAIDNLRLDSLDGPSVPESASFTVWAGLIALGGLFAWRRQSPAVLAG